MGAALGHIMPVLGPGSWVLVGMTSLLTAAIGCPLTSAMLALELTHNGNLMMPVLLACVVAYAVSVLVQPRSLLTENLSRKGLHLSARVRCGPAGNHADFAGHAYKCFCPARDGHEPGRSRLASARWRRVVPVPGRTGSGSSRWWMMTEGLPGCSRGRR